MKRNWINWWLDVLLLLGLWGLALTGLVMRYALPPGSGWRRALWGLNRHDWGDVHFWLSIGVVTLLAVHLALHWQWICATLLRLFRHADNTTLSPARRNVAGLIFLLGMVAASAFFLWLAQANVVETGGPGRGSGRGWGRGHAANEVPSTTTISSDFSENQKNVHTKNEEANDKQYESHKPTAGRLAHRAVWTWCQRPRP